MALCRATLGSVEGAVTSTRDANKKIGDTAGEMAAAAKSAPGRRLGGYKKDGQRNLTRFSGGEYRICPNIANMYDNVRLINLIPDLKIIYHYWLLDFPPTFLIDFGSEF